MVLMVLQIIPSRFIPEHLDPALSFNISLDKAQGWKKEANGD